jgi:hypothetical protein
LEELLLEELLLEELLLEELLPLLETAEEWLPEEPEDAGALFVFSRGFETRGVWFPLRGIAWRPDSIGVICTYP